MKVVHALVLLLFLSCESNYDISDEFEEVESADFFSRAIDADTIRPLLLDFCATCANMDEVIAYEESLGSMELEISNKMKYEWKTRSISLTFAEEKYGDLPLYVRSISFRIFIRKERPFKDYSLAMIYYKAPMSDKVEVTKAYIYPGDNFFGFVKEEGYQYYRTLEFPEVPDISPNQLISNYIAVLKWMETFVNTEVSLYGCEEEYGPFTSHIYRNEPNVVYEDPCIRDMLFYTTLLLTEPGDMVEPITFYVFPHAPSLAYYNHLPDDIYSSHYQFDAEDLAFEIVLRHEDFHSLPVKK